MAKALVVYGTRYGATANTAEVIADTLKQDGFEVKVVDAKKEKVQSISEFDLIIVGSGIQMGRWTKEPEDFLERFKNELSKNKIALFVSCGSANPLSEDEQKNREMAGAKRKYLEDKAAKQNLKPIALGFFGGCYDFNKMSWFFRKTLSSVKPKLEGAGYKESKPGFYDLRDLDGIRSWAKEVAKMVESTEWVLQRTVKNDLEDALIVQYVTMLMNGLLSEMELDERAREQSSRLSVRNCVRLSVFVCVCVSVSLTVSLTLSVCVRVWSKRERDRRRVIERKKKKKGKVLSGHAELNIYHPWILFVYEDFFMVNDDAQSRDKVKVDLTMFGGLLNLVGKLAGDQPNLKLDIQDLRLNLEGTKVTVNGKVNLNIVYSEEAEQANLKWKIVQVADKIAQMFESGKIVLSTGDIEALEMNVANKKIDLNIEDKDFLKRVRKIMSEFGRGPQGAKESEEKGKGKKKSSGALGTARTVAETLDKVGITLTLSYKGCVVVTLGSEANPTFLQLITKTRTIAINNLFKLVQMIV